MVRCRVLGFWMLLAPAVWALPSVPFPEPQPDLLRQFDQEHDLAAKERLLRQITDAGSNAGPLLLTLAESTPNSDTRWMAMRGMVTLRYSACAPFLEAALQATDELVRANAARALG